MAPAATRTRPFDTVTWGTPSTPTSELPNLASRLIRMVYVSAAIAFNDPPMQYDLCIWGEAHVWTWGARVVCGLSAHISFCHA